MNNKKLPRFEEESEKINDDSGYDIDSSGAIPKLEELKAQGSTKVLSRLDELDNEEIDNVIDSEFDVSIDSISGDEAKSDTSDNSGLSDVKSDISDDYLFGRDLSDVDYVEDEVDEDLSDIDFAEYDMLDQNSSDVDSEYGGEFDDLSNLKVNFYDEYADDRSEIARNLERIANALEIIAEKL